MVLERHTDSLIHTRRERHSFNRNLSVLVFDEILKRDLQLAEDLTLAGLKFRQLPTLVAK